MTLEQTRQLGIEFERRVQTMIPETEFANKLDTETIYSYLNQYQDKLIHDLYRSVDQVPKSNNQTYIETLLNSMLTTCKKSYKDIQYNSKYPTICSIQLPDNFGLYVNSRSYVKSSYKYKNDIEDGAGILSNTLIPINELSKVFPKPQDDMKILRSPVAWITQDKHLSVIYDRYTEPSGIWLEYYRIPKYMDLMTSTECELPMEMFEQVVSGAVDLYVQYVAGAEARKRQMAEQQQKQNRKNENE